MRLRLPGRVEAGLGFADGDVEALQFLRAARFGFGSFGPARELVELHVTPAVEVDFVLLEHSGQDLTCLSGDRSARVRIVPALGQRGGLDASYQLSVDADVVGRGRQPGELEFELAQLLQHRGELQGGFTARVDRHGKGGILPFEGDLAIRHLDLVHGATLGLGGLRCHVDLRLGDPRIGAKSLEDGPRHQRLAGGARMHGIAATDEGLRVARPRTHHELEVRVELVDEGGTCLLGHVAKPVRELPQGLVAFIHVRIRPAFLDGLRREERDTRSILAEHRRQLRLAAGIGAEDVGAELLVGVVVHPELDRDERRLERQDVPAKTPGHGIGYLAIEFPTLGLEKLSFVRMRSLAEPRGVAAPAHVAEGQVPIREARQRVGLDVRRVEALLGDAVAEEHDAVAIVDLELGGQSGNPDRQGRHKAENTIL